ncbi:MAG: hypothetical protein WCT08_00440 [Patescibacteria group bacterium]|jgi:hypothetical protein
MSLYAYIDTTELPQGWHLKLHNSACGFLIGPDGRECQISLRNSEYYFQTYEDGFAPVIQAILIPAIYRVTLVMKVHDPEHMAIIDCGESVRGSTTANVRKDCTFIDKGKRVDFIEISISGPSIEEVMALKSEILCGRQADEPYYKITSLKRWLKVRFMRLVRAWVRQNEETRGEVTP